MFKNSYLFFLLVSIGFVSVSNAGRTAELDSLLSELKKEQPDTSKVLLLTELSNKYIHFDPDSATLFAMEALVLANEIDYKEGLGEIFAILGDIEIRLDNLDNAKEHYLKAISYHEEAGFFMKLAPIYLVLGNVYLSQDNYVDALRYYQKGMQLAEELDNKRVLQYIYNNLGLTYKSLQDYTKSLNYFEQSLNVTKELGDSGHLATLYLNMGIIYEARGEFELARSYFDKSYAMNLEREDKVGQALVFNAIGELEIRQKQYTDAIPFFHATLGAIEEIESSYLGPRSTLLASALSNLGKCYYHLGIYDSSIHYLDKGLILSEQNGQVASMRDNSEILSRIYQHMNQIQKALDYFQLFKIYSDSIQNQDAIKRVTTLELQYLFDKELKEMELEQANREAMQKRKELIYLMVSGGAVLSVVIILLLFFLQRNKVKRIELSQENLELEKNSLQKELDFKNKELTTNVLYLLNKNELIMNITERLKKAKITIKTENKNTIEEIIRELQSGITKDTWKEFELRFQNVHIDFYNKLNEMFPDLSPNELRLCAFLRLNMTTKDIAALTYLSVNSINIARHRLRKKLNIEQEENLIKFLSQL